MTKGWTRLLQPRWLLPAAALALAASLMPLRWPAERSRFEHVVVLDITQSMNVEDVQLANHPVSRLDFAKARLAEALTRLPCGSRLGWGIFTEDRSLLTTLPMEVCANRAELRASLALIDGRMAWSGNSEIARGLRSAWVMVRDLPRKPALVFVTDGQEAPPLRPGFKPPWDDKPGEVQGLVVGVGGTAPQPIPKRDTLGRRIGTWGRDDVMHAPPGAGAASAAGQEHLSALQVEHLKDLAAERGFGWLKLGDADGLAAVLTATSMARPLPVEANVRGPLAWLALGLLVGAAWPWRRDAG